MLLLLIQLCPETYIKTESFLVKGKEAILDAIEISAFLNTDLITLLYVLLYMVFQSIFSNSYSTARPTIF